MFTYTSYFRFYAIQYSPNNHAEVMDENDSIDPDRLTLEWYMFVGNRNFDTKNQEVFNY